MAALADAIKNLNAKELDAHEAELAACFPSTTHTLSDEMKALLVPFVRWCENQRVRSCPALPTTVAAFWQAQKDRGIKPYETLLAIEGLHLFAGMANPVQTPVVRSVTESTTPVEAPRSWTKVEKDEFKLLPRHVQEVVSRREFDREKTMRRAQNDAAQYKNALLRLQQADAETSAAEPKENENGKEE
jgi:hypothetical protein